MAKRKRRPKQAPTVKPRSRWAALLIPGIVVLAAGAGAATWYFLQRADTGTTAAQYRGGARLAVEQELIDLGAVRFEKLVTASFRLKNVGDQPLRLPGNPAVDVVEGC
jgi:flagellar basal body-associated protein FliL